MMYISETHSYTQQGQWILFIKVASSLQTN